MNTFDVVIAGGGLSGALMAQSLATLSNTKGEKLSIAIIEATAVKQDHSLTFDDRVLALAHGSAQYLQSLDVWAELSPEATPIADIHISDRGYYGKARINAKEHNVDALGYVIEMALLGKSLINAVNQHANITWFCPTQITDINWLKTQVELTLDSGSTISTKLLIGCDGGQSCCRQKANITNTLRDYQQSAVIANVSTDKPHNNVAFERFTENGPLAMLPLSKGRCSLVWTLTPEQANKMIALNDDDFASELTTAFGQWLGPITQVGKRSTYPLVLVKAQEQVFHRMALVGNASHTIHPIAGQGFNLGLRDVQSLAALIKQAFIAGEDIGNFALLNQYALDRSQDQDQVITLTDSLVSLFSNQHCPLVLGRNIGLKIINYVSLLQNSFVEKTMGYR